MLSLRREAVEIRLQVNQLVTFMSELEAVLRGLSCKVWCLKRKVQWLLAEVTVSSVDEKVSILALLIHVL